MEPSEVLIKLWDSEDPEKAHLIETIKPFNGNIEVVANDDGSNYFTFSFMVDRRDVTLRGRWIYLKHRVSSWWRGVRNGKTG